MTRHDDRNRILAIGRADGTRVLGLAEPARERAVARGAAVGDLAQQCPNASLEFRSFGIEGKIETRARPREILRELPGGSLENLIAPRLSADLVPARKVDAGQRLLRSAQRQLPNRC